MATATHPTWLPLESISHREAVSDFPSEVKKGVESFHPMKRHSSRKPVESPFLSQGNQCESVWCPRTWPKVTRFALPVN